LIPIAHIALRTPPPVHRRYRTGAAGHADAEKHNRDHCRSSQPPGPAADLMRTGEWGPLARVGFEALPFKDSETRHQGGIRSMKHDECDDRQSKKVERCPYWVSMEGSRPLPLNPYSLSATLICLWWERGKEGTFLSAQTCTRARCHCEKEREASVSLNGGAWPSTSLDGSREITHQPIHSLQPSSSEVLNQYRAEAGAQSVAWLHGPSTSPSATKHFRSRANRY